MDTGKARNDVRSNFQSDWKQFLKKSVFSRFWAKRREVTPWDFGQNFRFAQTLCIDRARNDVWSNFQSDWKQF